MVEEVPVLVRVTLAERRARHVPFDRAWDEAVEVGLGGVPPSAGGDPGGLFGRRGWAEVLSSTRDAFERAYRREPQEPEERAAQRLASLIDA